MSLGICELQNTIRLARGRAQSAVTDFLELKDDVYAWTQRFLFLLLRGLFKTAILIYKFRCYITNNKPSVW